MSDKTIIAIHGAKESGKSTLAKALEYPIYSFAGPIKAMITTLLMEAGFTLDKINYWIHDENGKNEVIPHPINCTCRRLMQTLGTEWGRNLVNHEVWVNILFNKINQWDFPRVVIDDLRFPSEVDGLQLCPHKVLFVKVVRPDQVNADNHASEHGLPDEAFDLVIVNDYNTPQKYAYHATLKVLEALQDLGGLKMTTYSIEYCVVWAFNRTSCTTEPNRIIPLQQGHLLLDINEWREVFGQPEISMEQLARCLTRMKSEGKIRRISWSTHYRRNIWELVTPTPTSS